MSGLVSINSWGVPGHLYQGRDPVQVIQGNAGEWDLLREALQRESRTQADVPHPQGGAVGYITYEGDFCFGIYRELEVHSPEMPNPVWQEAKGLAGSACGRKGPWVSNFTPEEFQERVRRAQEYIRCGDIYQVNLAQRFSGVWEGNPCVLFEHLMQRSPAPGACFLDLGGRKILCASPELFLKIQGRQVMTRPIKGTRPRDRDPIRDGQLAYELMTDPKELAELIMITDLERNDLGRICEYGSVNVTDLLKLEKYPQVYHLVSTVEGELRDGVDPIDAVKACFPGGSITGAPKKRAMEIISELEGAPRGVYTGAIGYFGFNGDVALSMAIRTMVIENGELHFHVGSGITIDSDPQREYEETLHKARGIRSALEHDAGVMAEVVA